MGDIAFEQNICSYRPVGSMSQIELRRRLVQLGKKKKEVQVLPCGLNDILGNRPSKKKTPLIKLEDIPDVDFNSELEIAGAVPAEDDILG